MIYNADADSAYSDDHSGDSITNGDVDASNMNVSTNASTNAGNACTTGSIANAAARR